MNVDELRERDLFEPMQVIARKHHATVREMLGRSHAGHAVRARHEAWMHLTGLGWTQAAIGRVWGVDHSTVMAATKKLGRPVGARRKAAA